MHLYFLRHGEAGDREKWSGPDSERPLTDEGRAELRAAARGLQAIGARPAALLTSPLARARQTAEIAAEGLGLAVVEAPSLAPGCDLDALATALQPHQDLASVMVVGHEPDFSTLIGRLITPKGALARVRLKKGACCRVDLEGSLKSGSALAGRGTLAWLMTAQQLAGLSAAL